MKKYVITTTNGKFVSNDYFLNGLDFETNNIEDARIFEDEYEANEVIDSNGWDRNFLSVEIAETITVDKDNFEIFEFFNGYFGICEKGSFGGNCVYGGDSACEDHYNREVIEYMFENWDGTLYYNEVYGYKIEQ